MFNKVYYYEKTSSECFLQANFQCMLCMYVGVKSYNWILKLILGFRVLDKNGSLSLTLCCPSVFLSVTSLCLMTRSSFWNDDVFLLPL